MKQLARECGFELAGVTRAVPHADYARFDKWVASGYAGEMSYLTDRRGEIRQNPRSLLSNAQSILCVGKLYNPGPCPDQAGISRYAVGADYHDVLRASLKELAARIASAHDGPVAARACVDTAPLLERSYAAAAGLGWIGRNTCLINERMGSWFFLGELLLDIALEPDAVAPDRCGTCRRCIDACPTDAFVAVNGGWMLDARRCISYLTIEKHGFIDDGLHAAMGTHVFGCDICQDVCPWNRRSPMASDTRFSPKVMLPLEEIARLQDSDFRELFRDSPVWRTKYEGFLRNAAIAIGNTDMDARMEMLEALARHPNAVVSATAERVLSRIIEQTEHNVKR